jgi:hypothetical protein
MGRRKGEVTDRMRDRTHPFQVEMLVPDTGLGIAQLIMQRLAARHDYETTHRRDGVHRLMRWCFCSREAADGFAADCGGRRVDLAVDPAFLRVDRPDARELARRGKATRFGLNGLDGVR